MKKVSRETEYQKEEKDRKKWKPEDLKREMEADSEKEGKHQMANVMKK